MRNYDEYFGDALLKAEVVGDRFERLIETERLGMLEVPTGRLVAADPMSTLEFEAFDRHVEPGRYPVVASLVDGENALTKVQFAEPPAERWELATLPEEDPAELGDGEIFGYPVDAGVGCFMDAETAEVYERRLDEEPTDGQSFVDEMASSRRAIRSHVHRPDPEQAGNIVMFDTGGDGRFASYWGLDADGEIVSLVTDFRMVDFDREGRRVVETGDPERAEEMFDAMFANRSAGTETIARRARLAARRGEADRARQYFDMLPDNADRRSPQLVSRTWLAVEAAAAGDPDDLCRRIDREPDDLEARYQLGVRRAEEGDLEEGLEQFLQLVCRDASYGDDLGRRSMIRLFKLLPSEEVGEWRRKMGEAMWG